MSGTGPSRYRDSVILTRAAVYVSGFILLILDSDQVIVSQNEFKKLSRQAR